MARVPFLESAISSTGLHARRVQRVAVAEADLHNYLWRCCWLMQMRARRARALARSFLCTSPPICVTNSFVACVTNWKTRVPNDRPAAFPSIFSAGLRPACRLTWCSRVTRPHFFACRRRPLSPPRPGARTTPRTTPSPITMLINPMTNQGK